MAKEPKTEEDFMNLIGNKEPKTEEDFMNLIGNNTQPQEDMQEPTLGAFGNNDIGMPYQVGDYEEKPLEFEASPDLGFWEGGKSPEYIFKSFLTANPQEQYNLAKEIFGDEIGKQDKNGNFEFRGKAYTMNADGLSRQDFIDLARQAVALTPASRAVSGFGAVGKLIGGTAGYGATDAGQQFGVMASGGKEEYDPLQGAIAGVTGGVGEAFAPQIARFAKNRIGDGVNKVKGLFGQSDDVAKKIGDFDDVPLTPAEKNMIVSEGDLDVEVGGANQADKKELYRQELGSRFSDNTAEIYQEFDKKRNENMVKRVLSNTSLDEVPKTYGDLSKKLTDNFLMQDKKAKAIHTKAYKDIEEMGGAVVDNAGTKIVSAIGDMTNIEKGSKAGAVLQEVAKKLNKGKNINKNTILRNFETLNDARKILTSARNANYNTLGEVSDTVLENDLKNALKSYDDILGNAENTLMDEIIAGGSAETNSLARKSIIDAKNAYRDYAKVFKTGSVDKVRKALEQKSPEETLNFIFGAGNGNRKLSEKVVQELSAVPELKQGLKDATIIRVFTDLKKGNYTLADGKKVASQYNDTFNGNTSTAMQYLFSDSERKAILETVKLYRKIDLASRTGKHGRNFQNLSKEVVNSESIINANINKDLSYSSSGVLNAILDKVRFLDTRKRDIADEVLKETLTGIKTPFMLKGKAPIAVGGYKTYSEE